MTMMIDIPQADYLPPEIEDYRDQPLINALPPINSPKDTAKLLNRYPQVRESEKTLPGYIRRHAMMRILDEFLYPTKRHLQLEQTISGMIRRGYLAKGFPGKHYHRLLSDIDRVDFKAAARNKERAALSSSVIGCSGTGKTSAVEGILAGYPNQAIYHPKFQHMQLVWLKLDCPHDGSARSLCINFFRSVDDILGTDYEQLYVKSRSSAESMLGDIARVAHLHTLGILVIDEIQHLMAASSGGAKKLLNFFVTLSNVVKIPVLFVGTPKSLDLFSSAFRSARRASQIGSVEWNRFENFQGGGKEAEWDRFFSRMWKLQWFENPTPLTRPIKDLFWELTQGIAHVAVALFYLCQSRAVMAQREVIDQKLVRTVFNEELFMIHPMIKALQSGRESEILKYSDLDLPADKIRIVSQSDDEFIDDLELTEEKTTDKLSKLVEMLIHMEIGKDLAPMVAAQAIEEKPDEDLFGLVAHIKNLREQPAQQNTKTKVKKTPLKPRFQKQDLRLMRGEEKGATYHHLKNEGIILDITQYL